MRVRSFFAVGSALLASALLVAAASAGPYKVKSLQAISGPSPFAGRLPRRVARRHEHHRPRTRTGDRGQPREPAEHRRDLEAGCRPLHHPQRSRRFLAGRRQDVDSHDDPRPDGLHRRDGRRRLRPVGLGRRRRHRLFRRSGGDISTDPPTTAVVASHSSDGGRTWPAPATVAPPLQGNETDAITGSPTLAGHAYMAWANFTRAASSRGRTPWSSRARPTAAPPGRPPSSSTSRARSPRSGTPDPRAAQRNPAGHLRPRRLRDRAGQLLRRALARRGTDLAAARAGSARKPPLIEFFRSRDRRHPPATAASPARPSPPTAPSTSPSRTAARRARARSASPSRATAVSPGAARRCPGVSAFAFEPAIAVDRHGTVGVIWYDLRNDRPGDAALTADVWFAHSDDRGASWRQTHVAGPTDLRTAPLPAHN